MGVVISDVKMPVLGAPHSILKSFDPSLILLNTNVLCIVREQSSAIRRPISQATHGVPGRLRRWSVQ